MANYIGLYTKFKRESMRFLTVWSQTILSPVFTNLLYLAIFGLSLNRFMPESNGISYLDFLAPGLIVMGIINNAFQNPSTSLIISKYQGHITDLLIIPLTKIEILVAYLMAALLRALIIGIVTFITLYFFVDFHIVSIGIIFLSGFLISSFFGLLGFFMGLLSKEFDDIAIIHNFILTPMIFLGGVFYKISSLPQLFQKISHFNPIVYMVDVFRYGFTGLHEYSISLSLLIIVASNIIIGTITYLALKSGWRLQN